MTLRIHMDMSTAHITEQDNFLLREDAVTEENLDGYDVPEQPRVPCVEYAYGYIVFVLHHHENADDKAKYLDKIRLTGYSEAFCNLIKLAWEQDADMIRLDRDGEVEDSLPVFDW